VFSGLDFAGVDAVFFRERKWLAGFAEDWRRPILRRHDQRGRGVGGDDGFNRQLAIGLLPAAQRLTIRRFQFRFSPSQRAAGNGLDEEVFVAGILGVGRKSGDPLIHPLPDRAVGVMVKGIHLSIGKSILASVAVPTLPHRGRSLLD
jgi:hypothetical protein